MDYNYYALLVSENDRAGEKLVWKAPEKTKYGRQYFFGGSGILPCIYAAAQSAYSEAKKAREDFKEGSQFYVRKISLEIHPAKKNKKSPKI